MSTNISWTDETWSPVTGCTRVSDGCLNCYIERTPPMRMSGRRFDLPIVGGTTGVQLHPERLDKPLHWRKPRKVFVCSMADLFHEQVPDEHIAKVFATMAATPQHTYQVLTKRHGRMLSLLSSSAFLELVQVAWDGMDDDHEVLRGEPLPCPGPWPLANVWLGVSVEDQKWADIRIPALLDTPAAVRFLSCEPLLGPVDLSKWFGRGYCKRHRELVWEGDPQGFPLCCECGRPWSGQGIDWVIVGGESGPGARPMHPDWARSLRDQCTAAGVPFHYKQHGEWAAQDVQRYSDLMTFSGSGRGCVVEPDGRISAAWSMGGRDARDDGATSAGAPMLRVGKKAAGRELDGRTWDEFHEVSP